MSELVLRTPDPFSAAWDGAWASLRTQLDAWVLANPEDAQRRYDTVADKMRAYVRALCDMRTDVLGLPEGSDARRQAVAVFCDHARRYARYANLIYGGATAARTALWPDGSPCSLPVTRGAEGQLVPDVCAVGAAPALAAPAVIAVAIAVTAWIASDVADAVLGVKHIRELRKLQEAGAPPEAVAAAARGYAEAQARPGLSEGLAAAATSAASAVPWVVVGVVALGGAWVLWGRS